MALVGSAMARKVITSQNAMQRLAARWPRVIASTRRKFFRSGLNSAATIFALVVVSYVFVCAFRWAVLDGVFVADNPNTCKAAAGACWATIYHHAGIVFFGLYPKDQQWRPELGLAWIVVCLAVPLAVRIRSVLAALILLVAGWAGFLLLIRGGFGALPRVPPEQWGGLPLTIHIFLGSVVIGFPLAVLLSLGRNSKLLLIRVVCAAVIEIARGVPLLTILFCAAVVVPLMLPDFISPITLNRVILAMALFFACYEAEVIRGGMRAVRRTEIEGAQALGLKPFQTIALIVLPQAIRFTIPATVNLVVVAFKDTSLVVIVGLFDFLASANTAIASDAWAPFFGEIYLLVGLVFLLITNGITWLGRFAERRLVVLR